ncbi:tRNA pseudouridine synthase [Plakobranchus ocellatus]|uniref:tRNA pseudouridine synthase n=1 Tax=Plakobranchus ocellatus TaxID=259542 RepID=A0AAV4ANH6_9GAST|nr:tRNA pseudouridine synthase [Plakobranchus ocellatus]
MGRFLIYFSYIGTRYSGVQQQLNAIKKGKPVKTAGGVLEEALLGLKPVNSPRIQISSRTDKGVHAIRNTCHVDLEHPNEGEDYDPAVITNVANYNLLKMGEDVRVMETRQVAENFHSRYSATGRKYVYRLAHVTKPGTSMHLSGLDQSRKAFFKELKRYTVRSKYPKLALGSPKPCLDLDKLVICRNKVDMNKLLQAASLLSGIHNFTAFSNKHKERSGDKPPPHPVKLLTIGVKRGQPFGQNLLSCGEDITVTENIEFWDIHVRAKSFLYKMVRRCVGGMMLVATDAISLADLKNILDNPRRDFPFTSRISFCEDGLFLADVEYPPEAFDMTNCEVKNSVNRETSNSKCLNEGEGQELENCAAKSELSNQFNFQNCCSIKENKAGDREGDGAGRVIEDICPVDNKDSAVLEDAENCLR